MANAISSLKFGSGTYVFTTPYATCSTAASKQAKVATTTPGSNFSLETGARVIVKFTVTNTASSPTLNVNSTGAKSIYYRGSVISASYLAANRTYEFVYNGTQWDFIGDINTDSAFRVLQTATTSNASYPLLLAPSGQTSTVSTSSYFDSGVTLNPSTNTIEANVSGSAGSVAWGNVTGKPSSYPPDSHTHSYLPLSGGTLTGDVTVNAGKSIQLNTLKIPTSSGGSTYGVGSNGQVLKSNGTTVYWAADNNTHYTAYNYVGAADSASNAATTNGSTYLKLYENGSKRSQFKITGSGATTVSSDSNGNITISSTAGLEWGTF